MTWDSRRNPATHCPGKPHNCELLLSSPEFRHERSTEAGISGTEAIVGAMAVGLVISVWQNGPVEACTAATVA
jgi:hypothetical protein